MRKWREIYSLHFLIFSLFPPSLSISYIKNCHILWQNVKYSTFVANVTRTQHTRYEKTILSRIRCEEAPQVVPAWAPHIFRHCFHIFSICVLGQNVGVSPGGSSLCGQAAPKFTNTHRQHHRCHRLHRQMKLGTVFVVLLPFPIICLSLRFVLFKEEFSLSSEVRLEK